MTVKHLINKTNPDDWDANLKMVNAILEVAKRRTRTHELVCGTFQSISPEAVPPKMWSMLKADPIEFEYTNHAVLWYYGFSVHVCIARGGFDLSNWFYIAPLENRRIFWNTLYTHHNEPRKAFDGLNEFLHHLCGFLHGCERDSNITMQEWISMILRYQWCRSDITVKDVLARLPKYTPYQLVRRLTLGEKAKFFLPHTPSRAAANCKIQLAIRAISEERKV